MSAIELFGQAYIERNKPTRDTHFARVDMFSRILAHCDHGPSSILEVGANVGNNIQVLNEISGARLYATEPNLEARCQLVQSGYLRSVDISGNPAGAMTDFADNSIDLVFTSGVLIHLNPEFDLKPAMQEILRVARRYVLAIEYFSDKPEMIIYRGEPDRLWKRDFGKLYLESFPTLMPVAQGFEWRETTGLDNLTWWLFRKDT